MGALNAIGSLNFSIYVFLSFFWHCRNSLSLFRMYLPTNSRRKTCMIDVSDNSYSISDFRNVIKNISHENERLHII